MIRKSTLLATLAIASLMMACSMEPKESQAVSADEVASVEQDITALCHQGVNGDENYCTSTCKCGIGEGDCDGSTQCTAGLTCLFNIGSLYGLDPGDDVCDCPANSGNGGGSFCSAACPCDEGQGDCDSNTDPAIADCAPGLRCYTDAGGVYGAPFDAEDDVCATCLPASANGNIDFCNSSCQCGEGKGDCDADTDCATGLFCFIDVGADFQLPPDTDVCAACRPDSQNGHVHFCTPSCPCSVGQGDCDGNTECAPGLVCQDNVGAEYGLPADTDVCIN